MQRSTPPDRTPPNMRELQRQMQQQMLLRSGMSLFAVLAGLACYYGALHFGFNGTEAGIAGFVFALLVWIAARSLLRDWFPSTARGTPPPSTARGTPPPSTARGSAPENRRQETPHDG